MKVLIPVCLFLSISLAAQTPTTALQLTPLEASQVKIQNAQAASIVAQQQLSARQLNNLAAQQTAIQARNKVIATQSTKQNVQRTALLAKICAAHKQTVAKCNVDSTGSTLVISK